ncbi:MAG: NAD(P)H-dependent oxidoreductase subunit E [Vulcanimicrobiaceae bacterium]
MPETAARDFATVRAQVQPEAQRLIAQYPESRSALLPILHAFQTVEGWVSPQALAATAQWLDLPLSVVESTASFYTLFYRLPVGKYMLQPCRGVACIIGGAPEIMAYFRRQLGIGHLETTADGTFSYEEVECLAACDRASCMQVNLDFVYDLTKEKIDAMLAAMRAGTYAVPPAPQSAAPGRTWHVANDPPKRSAGAQGVVDPNSPGGIGDRSGLRMLERLVEDPSPVRSRPTNERLVRDGADRVHEIEDAH